MGKVLDFGFWILDFGFWIEIVGCISGRGLNIGGQPGAAMLNTSQLDHPAFYPRDCKLVCVRGQNRI